MWGQIHHWPLTATNPPDSSRLGKVKLQNAALGPHLAGSVQSLDDAGGVNGAIGIAVLPGTCKGLSMYTVCCPLDRLVGRGSSLQWFLACSRGKYRRCPGDGWTADSRSSQSGAYESLSYTSDTVILHIDNKSAIRMANNTEHHRRTYHIDAKHHYIREFIKSGEVTIKWINS